MPNQNIQLDRVFQALADPTRLAVLERLRDGPAPVSELAQPFGMVLPSFLQHIGVLERCQLLRSKKVGRVRICQLEPETLKRAEDWMAEQRILWERRLDQFDDLMTKLNTNKEQS